MQKVSPYLEEIFKVLVSLSSTLSVIMFFWKSTNVMKSYYSIVVPLIEMFVLFLSTGRDGLNLKVVPMTDSDV